MEAFSVEIVTPIKILNQESVKYIRCPGIDGSFGIMKKHREGVFALDIGEIKIETNSILSGKRIVITGTLESMSRAEVWTKVQKSCIT